MVESFCLEYRNQLAMSKEEAIELSAAVFLRNSNYVEVQRRLFRNTRHMEGNINGSSTFKVTAQENGNQVEYTEKVRQNKLLQIITVTNIM